MKPLRPFFSFFGSKSQSIKYYPQPVHPTIIEPFAGSATYSLNYHWLKIKLFDLDPVIVGIWNYLINIAKEDDILNLPDTVDDVSTLNIPIEAKWLIGFIIVSGRCVPATKPGSWQLSCTRPLSYWGAEKKKVIASQLKYIRHWEIQCDTYENIRNQTATWFVDPPYHRSGKNYKFNEIDYGHLGHWCKERWGQVMVCEQEGATWLPFQKICKIKNLTKKKVGELLWQNKKSGRDAIGL